MKKRIFSGIQPSGNLHLGNYLGAIKNWVELQKDYDCIYCIVDLHAITIRQDPKLLRKRIIELANLYIAAGVNPKKSAIFVQSNRPEHAELTWILNCFTGLGQLLRMTQFKDKAKVDFEGFEGALKDTIKTLKQTNETKEAMQRLNKKIMESGSEKFLNNYTRKIQIESAKVAFEASLKFYSQEMDKFSKAGMGLFDYPVLMAADILLYNTNVVPVGEDQKQHIEITRDLANRFNNRYGKTFVVPEPLIKEVGARIMGLDDPTKKMSKSAGSKYNYIGFDDSPEEVRDKVLKAVTDSGKEIKFDEKNKPAISNLLTICSLLSKKSIKDLEKQYSTKGYAEFKKDLAEVVVGFIGPLQNKIKDLEKDPDYTKKVLREGAEKIAPIAEKTLKRVKEKVGLG